MTNSLSAINEFITDIYSTVLDAERWTEVLNQTVWFAGAKGTTICLVDHVAEELNSLFMCSTATQMQPVYMQGPHIEGELKAIGRLPQVQTTAEFIDVSTYIDNANKMYADDPIDISDAETLLANEWSIKSRYISRLNIQPSYLDLHTMLFDDRPKESCQEGIAKIELLIPHFAKAIEISRPFLLLKSRFQATLDVLDRFHLGVFIVSPTGSVALKNTAADRILGLADAVSLDSRGRLRANDINNSLRLEKLIEELLYKQSQGTIKHSTEIILQRHSANAPYLVEISPLYEETIIGRVVGLMVIMIDPDYRKIISTRGMKEMFGLTKAEDNVCQLLVDGYSTSEIAEARNVSPITVKNQIKTILDKTGKRTRSDLIRQALTINLPVDRHDAAQRDTIQRDTIQRDTIQRDTIQRDTN